MTPSINLEVQERLIDILKRDGVDEKKVMRSVMTLEKTFKDVIYSNLLSILCNLQFSESAARAHWRKILAHKDDLSACEGRPVDFRVALLDYFLAKSKKMKNPVVVEIKIYQQTKTSSIVDELTGLYNYRYFLTALKKEEDRAGRYSSPFSLLMLDVDDFKDFNDKHGHLAGNEALKKVAQILRDNVRGVDIVSRYGGEEFAAILPETNKAGALTIAERIRKEVEKQKFAGRDGSRRDRITVSGGVATYLVDAKSTKDLLQMADSALYIAKSQGKNSIHLYLNERRSYARISNACIGNFWVLSSDYHTFETKNISHNGLLFEADTPLPLGTVLEMKLNLPSIARQVSCKTRVARAEESEKGKFDIGVKILEMAKKDRQRFNEYVRSSQASYS